MIKREGYRIITLEPYKSRLEEGLCPTCAKPKDEWKRRKDWCCCSVKCTEEFVKNGYVLGWGALRMKAFERDKFKCVKCGAFHEAWDLIGDHIKPISLGGDEWDLNNIQTLCSECNKIKTKADQGDIAKQRAIEKKQEGNQTLSWNDALKGVKNEQNM